MQDIDTSEDITRLVHTFYERVGRDEMLSPAFNQVAQVDWETHLPKMVGFWETLLFKVPNYKGNPPLIHQQLHAKMKAEGEPFTLEHFNHWIDLFKQTVDDLFAGPTADAAKRHAYQIGRGLTVHLFDMTAWHQREKNQ